MVTDTPELLPCPFCGTPGSKEEMEFEDKTFWVVGCDKCGSDSLKGGVDMTIWVSHDDLQTAIAAWNRRVNDE